MCLEPSYFIEREKVLKKYQALGYIDLDEIPHLFGIEGVKESDLFQASSFFSTISLYRFELSDKGSAYFRYIAGEQLFLLKPERVRDFLVEMKGDRSSDLN